MQHFVCGRYAADLQSTPVERYVPIFEEFSWLALQNLTLAFALATSASPQPNEIGIIWEHLARICMVIRPRCVLRSITLVISEHAWHEHFDHNPRELTALEYALLDFTAIRTISIRSDKVPFTDTQRQSIKVALPRIHTKGILRC